MRTLLLLAAALVTSGCLIGTTAPPLDPGTSSLPAGNAAAREGAVIGQLGVIKRGEDLYFAKNGSYATMQQLVQDGALSVPPDQLGYTIDLTATASGYTLVAVPVKYGPNGKRSFYMDQTGIVRGDDHMGGAATASDPPAS